MIKVKKYVFIVRSYQHFVIPHYVHSQIHEKSLLSLCARVCDCVSVYVSV